MITGIPEGSIVITPHEARIAYQLLRIREVRTQLESSSVGWKVLNEIAKCAFHTAAERGNEPRQDAATEKTEYTTVSQVAQRARTPERTVRHHLEIGILPGEKVAGRWSILTDDADVYLAARRKN